MPQHLHILEPLKGIRKDIPLSILVGIAVLCENTVFLFYNQTGSAAILLDQARLLLPGEKPQMMSLPCRSTADCLMEELAQLDPDDLYASVIRSDFDFSGDRV